MADEYIKRSDAIEEIANNPVTMSVCLSVDEAKGRREERDIAIESIKRIPAADVVEVKRGKWIHVQWHKDETEQEGGYWISRCSNCTMPYHTETTYCPNCGAKMMEAEE